MNKPVHRIRSFLLPSALWALLGIAAVVGIVFASRWNRLGRISSADVFAVAACAVILLLLIAVVASFRIIVDEKGATQYAGFRNRVYIPWDEVRSVTVARIISGRRMIFISRVNEPVLQPKSSAEAQLNRQKTFSLEYSQKRLDCIRHYWKGHVNDLTLPEPKL